MTLLGRDQLLPGQSWTLPDGSATVTFDGYVEWASFTVARDPGKELALVAAVVAITGLALSLLVRRRRVWVRVARDEQGATVVEVAGLTRSEHTTVAEEVDALTSHLAQRHRRARRHAGRRRSSTWTSTSRWRRTATTWCTAPWRPTRSRCSPSPGRWRATRGRDLVPATAGADSAAGGSVAVATKVETTVGGPDDGALPPGRRAGNIAMSVMWLGTILLGTGVLLRGLSVGRAPWGNMYEFSITGAFGIALAFLVLSLKRDLRWLGIFVVIPVLLTLGAAVTFLYTDAAQLVPALRNYWLVIHVSAAVICRRGLLRGGGGDPALPRRRLR